MVYTPTGLNSYAEIASFRRFYRLELKKLPLIICRKWKLNSKLVVNPININIMPELNVQRKRKNLWWLWLVIIVLLIIAITYFFLPHNSAG